MMLYLLQKSEYGMDISGYATNPDWDLISTPGQLNEIFYGLEPYQDITFKVHIRRRTIPYWRKVIIPAFSLTVIAILSFLIPPSSPTPRLLVIFLIFMLFCFTVPKDLPEHSLLSSMLSCSYFTLFCILVHSIIVTAMASPLFLKSVSCNNKILRCLASAFHCGKHDEHEKISEEEIREGIARTLDILAGSVLFVLFLLGFGWHLLSAPHLLVY